LKMADSVPQLLLKTMTSNRDKSVSVKTAGSELVETFHPLSLPKSTIIFSANNFDLCTNPVSPLKLNISNEDWAAKADEKAENKTKVTINLCRKLVGKYLGCIVIESIWNNKLYCLSYLNHQFYRFPSFRFVPSKPKKSTVQTSHFQSIQFLITSMDCSSSNPEIGRNPYHLYEQQPDILLRGSGIWIWNTSFSNHSVIVLSYMRFTPNNDHYWP